MVQTTICSSPVASLRCATCEVFYGAQPCSVSDPSPSPPEPIGAVKTKPKRHLSVVFTTPTGSGGEGEGLPTLQDQAL